MPWPSFDDERKLALGSLGVMISNFRTIGNLLLSGVLERHPTLHIVSVESGLGWIPFLLEGLDYEIGECAPHIADHLSLQAVGVLPAPGARVLLVRARPPAGCDRRARAATTSCSRPTSRTRRASTRTASMRAAEPLRAIEPSVRRKILSGNAAALYRIPVPEAAAAVSASSS